MFQQISKYRPIVALKADISQMCDKVAGSSPKGSRKGAMVKGGCFLPLKTRKALENQGLLCWGAKLLPQYGAPRQKYTPHSKPQKSFKGKK